MVHTLAMRRLPIVNGIDRTAYASLATVIGNVCRFFIQRKPFDATSPRQPMTIALGVLGAELCRPFTDASAIRI